MLKSQYEKLLENQPWQEMETHFNTLPVAKVEPIAQIKIETEDWIRFTVDNFELAQQNYEEPKEHYVEDMAWLSVVNNRLGRNRHNSFELNYGIKGTTNEQLIEMLGWDNIDRLGIERDCILIRLLVNMPGNGVPWHWDAAESYLLRFPEVTGLNACTRLWFPVVDWCNGHAFQIGNSVLTHWKAGNVWNIPWGVPHASTNFGYNVKYTVSLTGKLRE